MEFTFNIYREVPSRMREGQSFLKLHRFTLFVRQFHCEFIYRRVKFSFLRQFLENAHPVTRGN